MTWLSISLRFARAAETFLILRATGDDEYNPYIRGLCHLNSVATIIIPNRDAAIDPFVSNAINHASAIFIAGGDQANYINFWMNTPVQVALERCHPARRAHWAEPAQDWL